MIAPPTPLHAQASPYHPLTSPTSLLHQHNPPPYKLDEIAQSEVAATMAEIRKIMPILCYLNGSKLTSSKNSTEKSDHRLPTEVTKLFPKHQTNPQSGGREVCYSDDSIDDSTDGTNGEGGPVPSTIISQ